MFQSWLVDSICQRWDAYTYWSQYKAASLPTAMFSDMATWKPRILRTRLRTRVLNIRLSRFIHVSKCCSLDNVLWSYWYSNISFQDKYLGLHADKTQCQPCSALQWYIIRVEGSWEMTRVGFGTPIKRDSWWKEQFGNNRFDKRAVNLVKPCIWGSWESALVLW